jgi:hypothetical protein
VCNKHGEFLALTLCWAHCAAYGRTAVQGQIVQGFMPTSNIGHPLCSNGITVTSQLLRTCQRQPTAPRMLQLDNRPVATLLAYSSYRMRQHASPMLSLLQ